MTTFKNNVTGSENAIEGVSVYGRGVIGESTGNEGVRGVSHSPHAGVVGINDSPQHGRAVDELVDARHLVPTAGNGGWFESEHGEGVRGWAKTKSHGGVVGVNTGGGSGVYGQSDDGVGVLGESKNNEGVRGISHRNGRGGVVGLNTAGGSGVYGSSDDGVGIWGSSINYEGVHAETNSKTTAAMAAYQKNPDSDTPALFVKHDSNRTAAIFVGNIEVTGDIQMTKADCAEDFDISDEASAEPGEVMVLDDEGNLRASSQPYDKRVAGVISGAGDYKPGLVLDKQKSPRNRQPIALLGKAFCKVDAHFGAIAVGDLLTTSPTAGHAMRADDPIKAFGAVIGKALRPLSDGRGLIPILIALQ